MLGTKAEAEAIDAARKRAEKIFMMKGVACEICEMEVQPAATKRPHAPIRTMSFFRAAESVLL